MTNQELDFIRAHGEDFLPYVRDNPSEIDYQSLIEGTRIILLGDTDHRQTGIEGGLASIVRNFGEIGVTHLGIELPRSGKYLEAIRRFNESGDVSRLVEIAEHTYRPVKLRKFLKNARDAGLKVEAIDMPHEERNPQWSPDKESNERGKYMGRTITELCQDPSVKILVGVGFGHLVSDEIPAQLDAANLRYRKIAVVTTGQPAYMGIPQHFISMGAVSAVASQGLHDKTVYVDMKGKYGIDGFIHFPRTRLLDSTTNGVRFINGGTEVLQLGTGSEYGSTALVPLDPSANLPAISFNFEERVNPHCEAWERTNRDKIFEFVETLNGLNTGQKLSLAIMLENYVRLTMRHGGGSIYHMEFDPESRAFGFDTVDTFHYPYKLGVDYGSLARHREVTVETLIREFGFEDLMVKDLKDLPKTDIRPNKEKPDSLYKFLLLLSASATHPELITSWRKIGIYSKPEYKQSSEAYVVSLGLDDFELNDLEKGILGIAKGIETLSGEDCRVSMAIYDSLKGVSKWRFLFKRSLEGLDRMHRDLDVAFSYIRVKDKAESSIIGSRKNLQYLPREFAEEFLTYVDDVLKKYTAIYSEIEQVARRHQQLNERVFERGSNKLYTINEAMQQCKSIWQSVKDEVDKVRGISLNLSLSHEPVKYLSGRAVGNQL